MALLNFDASQVDPSVAFDPIPAGRYLTEITASEMKPTKTGNGEMLQLEFTVLDGEFKGRKVWDRLCIRHANSQTVTIAQANLSAICHAVGVLRPQDSMQLHHIPLVVTVKCKADESGEIHNEIKGYAKRESKLPTTTGASQPPPTPEANQTAPWER